MFSAIGSVSFRGIKAASPDWVITALFIGVGMASLLSVWRKDSSREGAHSRLSDSKDGLVFKVALGGFALGGLVAMKGLKEESHATSSGFQKLATVADKNF